MGDRDLRRLLEAADNFVKYGAGSERSRARARERYEEVLARALESDDRDAADRARLRLQDLERAPEPDVLDQTIEREPAGDGAAAPERVPPGQRVKRGWPVLHEGRIPRFDAASWQLRVWGEVAETVELSYEDIRALPVAETTSDFHCVTGWSKLDNRWTGVRATDVLGLAAPTENASHVLVHAEYGYTANIPLEIALLPTTMLAWGHDGRDLEPKHGFPLRLVVPQLYAWKSVKWVRGLEVLDGDRRGFWEVRGYHNRADPWKQERYSYQE